MRAKNLHVGLGSGGGDKMHEHRMAERYMKEKENVLR
jgi:hypothetical protein